MILFLHDTRVVCTLRKEGVNQHDIISLLFLCLAASGTWPSIIYLFQMRIGTIINDAWPFLLKSAPHWVKAHVGQVTGTRAAAGLFGARVRRAPATAHAYMLAHCNQPIS